MQKLISAALLAWTCCFASSASAATATDSSPMTNLQTTADTLSSRQQAIVPIAAHAAVGDMARLSIAINQGLDTGLTVNDAKEILVQLYAYAGFPRSLNALGELMRVVEDRKKRGLIDAIGRVPTRTIPTGDALLAAGTANQTKLLGAPVKEPLFEFAPAADLYLKSHLFGDIFERDNLDWKSRELATVGMLSALQGVDPQLQSHVGISMNIGITESQLKQVAQIVTEQVNADAGTRIADAIKRHLTTRTSR